MSNEDVRGCPILKFDNPCYKDLCPWYMHGSDGNACVVSVIAESMSNQRFEAPKY